MTQQSAENREKRETSQPTQGWLVGGGEMGERTREDELLSSIQRRLEAHAKDLPFALIYLYNADGRQAGLRCAHGATAGDAIAPNVIDLDAENAVWPAPQLLATATPVIIDDLSARFAALPNGP